MAWLVALTVVDIRRHRLPNILTLPGAAVVIIVAVATGRGLPALLGALILTACYLVVHLVSPTAMGAGDVKLALGLGALAGAFGVDAWVWTALGAPLLTALWALLSRHRVLPHGPAMCVAAGSAVGLSLWV